MGRAGTYNVLQDFGTDDEGHVSTDAWWIIAVIRLAVPLTFSRASNSSIHKDISEGAKLRAEKPLVITDDCTSITIQNSKKNPHKTLSANLLQTDINYLVEILPGDHVLAWIVNNRTDHNRIISQIDEGKACNAFNDGLKFVGRVNSIGKTVHNDRSNGVRSSSYNLQCLGFKELQTHFFYDNALASHDATAEDMGTWLARMGIEFRSLFGESASKDNLKNNVNKIVPILLNLIVGKGPPDKPSASPTITEGVNATPQLDATKEVSEASYSYIIPAFVGQLLGKEPSKASKPGAVMAYADILELQTGVHSYSNKTNDTFGVFTPDFDPVESTSHHRLSTIGMLGTWLPYMPSFANIPLWQVFHQYLNPTINELYTVLRVNPQGNVVPTIMMRQIPFTTEAFTGGSVPGVKVPGGIIPAATNPQDDIPFTRFLDVPRWIIPPVCIDSVHLERSDDTRTNFVHIYGSSSLLTKGNVSVQQQIINNHPIRDDLDIQRSGMHPYMTTVECFVDSQIGTAPSTWMALVADWMIGSQLTLTGTINSIGIQSPICEGDNLEFDGVVYHIESVSHHASIQSGYKSWSTNLTLTNGMRAVDLGGDQSATVPIYPGLKSTDNLQYDPGTVLEHVRTTDGNSTLISPEQRDSGLNRDNDTQLQIPEDDALKNLL